MRRLLLFLLLFPAAVAQARLSGSVVPSHYAVMFEPDLEAATFRGEETIDVDVRQPAREITLNAIELSIDRAVVLTAGRRQTAQVTYNPNDETATLHLHREIAGPASLRITFRGRLNDQLRGFYLSRTKARRYAVTQFEATDARRAFPSFDEPAMKATFDISVVADRNDMAISNGAIVKDTPGPGPGKHTVTFATTPKMSTYLAALLVGDFQCSAGGTDKIPVRVCATPENVRLTKFALRAAEQELAFYNSYYGMRYPYGKLDIIAVPDFQAGAMENTAAITFRESALLVDEAKSSAKQLQYVAEVIAHEVAHQWFGDLVTMRWWNDTWLNEGFADWITPKAVAAFRPDWNVIDEQALNTSQALTFDALQATHPIRVEVETPEEINEIFDSIAYDKTAAVLRMVESFVGEQAFRDGIRAYVAKYAYGNAAAEDFWNTMTEVTKQPFDRIMPAFVNQPGAPLVSVAERCEGNSTIVNLSQRRLYRSRSQFLAGSNERWAIPLVIADLDHPESVQKVVFSEPSWEMKLPGCSPHRYVNRGGFGYFRSEYAPPSMNVDVQRALTPAERISFLSDEWALVQIGERSVADHLGRLRDITDLSDRGVASVVTSQLASIGRDFITTGDRAAFESWVREDLRPAAAQFGWSAKAGESDDVRQVRPMIFYTLGWSGADTDVLREARRLAGLAIADPASVDPSMMETVLELAAIRGDAALFDAYVAQLGKDLPPEQRERFLLALTEFRDPALVQRAVKYGLSGEIRSQDRPGFLAALLQNPAGGERVWSYLQSHWSEVQSGVPTWSMPSLVRGLGALCDTGAADGVTRFFASHREPAAERTLRQATEGIKACVETRTLQAPRLEAMLAQQPVAAAPGHGQKEKH